MGGHWHFNFYLFIFIMYWFPVYSVVFKYACTLHSAPLDISSTSATSVFISKRFTWKKEPLDYLRQVFKLARMVCLSNVVSTQPNSWTAPTLPSMSIALLSFWEKY